MRSFILAAALFLSVGACATTGANRPINVASVRSEINGTIRAQENDRSIHSMGRVEASKAVVYTTNKATGEKQEETWVKDGTSWKLESSAKIAAQ